MKKNFSIVDNISLSMDNQDFDLHNCYDFISFELSNSDNQVRLLFKPIDDYRYELPMLQLRFNGVSVFALSPKFASEHNTDSIEIGYKEPDNVDYDYVYTEEQASPNDHIVLFFSDSQYMRINAKTATLEKLSHEIDIKKIYVIFDPHYGEAFLDLWKHHDIWIFNSPENNAALEKARSTYDDLTIFNGELSYLELPQSVEEFADDLEVIIDHIDHGTRLVEITWIQYPLTKELEDYLLEYNLHHLLKTSHGFTIRFDLETL